MFATKNKQLLKECRKIIRQNRRNGIGTVNIAIHQMRKQAFKNLEKQMLSLIKQHYHERIVLGIVSAKSEIIACTCNEEGFCHLIPCSYPYFNGSAYVPSVPEDFYIPEEECVHWASFFASGQRSEAGMKRYDELLALVFDDYDEDDIEEIKKRKLKKRAQE